MVRRLACGAVWTLAFLVCILTSPVYAQSPLETLREARRAYPANGPVSPEQIGELLNLTAFIHQAAGWRLLGKKEGTSCPMPNGTPISCDYLVHQPTLHGYDVLIDAGGKTTVHWSGPEPLSQMIASGRRTVVMPVEPTSGTPVPIVGDDALFKKVEQLEALVRLQAETFTKQLADLNARIANEADTREWRLQDISKSFMQHKQNDPHFSECKSSMPWIRIPVHCELVP